MKIPTIYGTIIVSNVVGILIVLYQLKPVMITVAGVHPFFLHLLS